MSMHNTCPPSLLILIYSSLWTPIPSFPTHQNNHTYANSIQTATKNPTHTFHPTPVFSAIRNIRVIVPLSRTRVLSKLSFMVSAREEELRISSPMEMVSWEGVSLVEGGKEERENGRL